MDSPNLSSAEGKLLAVIRHELRLPILVMLEQEGELSVPLLRDRLGLEKYDPVYHAVDQLVAAGFVKHVRTDSGTQTRWFRTTGTGWVDFRAALRRQAGA